MKLASLSQLTREPFQSGIFTGFAALGSAATINIISSLILGSATAPGTSGFLLATAVSIVAGTISGLRASRLSNQLEQQCLQAEAFANGDYYSGIRKSQQDNSRVSRALSAVAERQLQIDTNHARLLKDAGIREEQFFAAIDAIEDEIAVYDCNGILVVTNRAFANRCTSMGSVVAPGMLKVDVLNALAKSPGAGMPLNEREGWLTVQTDRSSEALRSKQAIRFNRLSGEPATLTVEQMSNGNKVEIIRDISKWQALEDKTARALREADAAERIKAVTLSRLSHTIRTPMTGVITAAELLINSELNAVQKSRLDIIRRSAGTLLGVVQDMFDIVSQSHGLTGPQSPMSALPPTTWTTVKPTILINEDTEIVAVDHNLGTDIPPLGKMEDPAAIKKPDPCETQQSENSDKRLDVLILEHDDGNQIVYSNSLNGW